MKNSKYIAGVFLGSIPGIAIASDPTPLFILFVAIPLIVISIALFVLCLVAFKAGFYLSIPSLIFHLVAIVWASNVGYMEGAGFLLLLSVLINLAGIVLGAKKISQHKKDNETT